jgi:hypothetical protein
MVTKPSRRGLAARHTRMLLIKSGLSEAEAEKLLDHLGEDVSAGNFQNDMARGGFLKSDLDELKTGQRLLAENSSDRRTIILGLASSVGGNYLTKLLDKAIELVSDATSGGDPVPGQDSPRETIRVEWMGGKIAAQSLQTEPLIRRALEIHGERFKAPGHMAAFYHDGIGMLVDAKGHSHTAEQQRRAALEIAERVHGPVNENTGAALINLGVCLLRQKKYNEGDGYLGMGLRALIDSVGMSHISTAAAIYNLYRSYATQGKLKHLKIPHQFTRNLRQIRLAADQMTIWKFVTVVLLSVVEVAENLKTMVGDGRQ